MTAVHSARLGLTLLGLLAVYELFSSCAGSQVWPVGVNGQTLIGLTQARLQTCAEAPIRTVSQPSSSMLVYYREGAMFEESFVGGKGSKPGYHHGCWATLLMEEGRVTGVEFRPVPDPDADTHECQEIFAACAS
jgi:hypothetical protein